ncbi:MAG TPA: hypothetical protein VGF92_05425 [Stellaceae bacterium]|jgi:hypothetical protein
MRFDARIGEWIEPSDRLCSLFDLGAKVSGNTDSTATQTSSVSFIPSVSNNSSQPLVSSFPAGQGLSTLNTALPGSAAFLPSTYAGLTTDTASSTTPSLTTLLLLGALAAGAFFLLRKHL